MRQRFYAAGFLALVLVCVLLGSLYLGQPAWAQAGLTNFDTVWISNDLVVFDDTSTEDFTVTDLASIADLAVTEQMTLSDDLTVAGDQISTPCATIVVSDGSTITPLCENQPISSTGTTGTNVIGGCTTGRRVVFTNMANTSPTISDSGNLRLGGNRVVGQYDVLAVRCINGTLWQELYFINN